MPEYLSPGVYVEEFEIGAKPIEGVSTSTAGFVGMTEMGPINKPTLVTNFGEYQRIFGGYLDYKTYGNKCFLPYSVEGFFSNGGQRLYVTRVAKTEKENDPTVAKKSKGSLPNVSGVDTKLDADAEPRSITLKIADPTGFDPKYQLLIKDGPQSEYLWYIRSAKALTLDAPLPKDYPKDTEITKMDEGAEVFEMKEDVSKTPNGETETKIVLDDTTDMTKLDLYNILIIKEPTNSEICEIQSKSIATDTEKWIKVSPLRYGHLKTNVDIKKLTPSTSKTKIISNVKSGYTIIPINNTDNSFNANVSVNIDNKYFIVQQADNTNVILIDSELKYKHDKNRSIKQLINAIDVEAANEGTWGDRIRIKVNESSITKTKLKDNATDQEFIELETVSGIEKGTLLKIKNTKNKNEQYATVKEVIKDISKVILEDKITVSPKEDMEVLTVEFDLNVNFDSMEEIFTNLSMDPDHSRYFTKIITKDTSTLIRVTDPKVSENPFNRIPMPTTDKIPAWKLSEGSNGIPSDTELSEIYKGKPNNEPLLRTGLETLKNIDGISIVAMPGITTQDLQNQVIIHCETMKDRFAVLDSLAGADLDGIQTQRNFYDSKFASLYYPWLRVLDPISKKPINVPPSGYMCGIYARSDTERGVHKAPANEVVNGALDLEEISEASGTKRIITKGQQDILNPKGINCIRVFPGRGIRVWGARTISSDSLWKYINIRRLFIYVEGSIYKGTQWVVFEPNNEKLWGRVKATIDEFLTRVWRDGALMGLKAEEAFFIKCDRTTMTQSDIDNGRLICIIGIAPVKPAEFVIFRIAQWAGGSAAKE